MGLFKLSSESEFSLVQNLRYKRRHGLPRPVARNMVSTLVLVSLLLATGFSAEMKPIKTSFNEDSGYYSSRSTDSLLSLAPKIHSHAFLGKETELFALMEDIENIPLLDCRVNSKCPIETAFARHHRALAKRLLSFMAQHLKYDDFEETLSKGEGLDSVPFRIVYSDDLEALRTMMDVMGSTTCNSTFTCTWGQSNLLEYSRAFGKMGAITVLQNEYHCHDVTAKSGSMSSTTSSNESPRHLNGNNSVSINDAVSVSTSSPDLKTPKKSKSWSDRFGSKKKIEKKK